MTGKMKYITWLSMIIWLVYSFPALAVQVVGSGQSYSTHSYEQVPPDVGLQKEILPKIIHHAPVEIPASKDFRIVTTITDLGLGVPIVHYRFGDSKKYFTSVLKPAGPETFDFKIMSAALNDDKIEYYFEVATGSRILAHSGSEIHPISVKITAPANNNVAVIIAILVIGALATFKLVNSAKQYKPATIGPVENKQPAKVSKLARSRIK